MNGNIVGNGGGPSSITIDSAGGSADSVVAEVRDGVLNALFTKVLASVAVAHPGTDTWVSGADNTNTNGRTFTTAQGIRKLTVFASPLAAFAAGAESDEYIDVVVDGGNGGLAKDILDEALTDTVSDTHAYYRIPFNQRVELPISESIIGRVDFKPTSVAKIVVEGE